MWRIVVFLLLVVLLDCGTTRWPVLVQATVGDNSNNNNNNPTQQHRTLVRRKKYALRTSWRACRYISDRMDPSQGCLGDDNADNDILLLQVPRLPMTALTVLLHNQQISGLEWMTANTLFSSTNTSIYYGTNLLRLPDISLVGREYYTLLYEYDIPQKQTTTTTTDPRKRNKDPNRLPPYYRNADLLQRILRLDGINYRAKAWLDGQPLQEYFVGANNHSTTNTTVDGMFRRRFYNVQPGGRFTILIEPPLHVGQPTPNQQGGNHELAQDGPIAQYWLGWDFCAAMPDRATGFYGTPTVIDTIRIRYNDHTTTSPPPSKTVLSTTLSDPAVRTIAINDTSVTLEFLVRVFVQGKGNATMTSSASSTTHYQLLVGSDWFQQWQTDLGTETVLTNECFDNGCIKDISLLGVAPREYIELWWPHGMVIESPHKNMGASPSRNASRHYFPFEIRAVNVDWADDKETKANHEILDQDGVNAGIRTVETYLDKELGGQVFLINGQKIYLVGGNWVSTDQANRFSGNYARYCYELALHKAAGLNLIRLWGGGTSGELDDFYNCADSLGILVYAEFWMTGDNNGRWAGNCSWPNDYSTYLANVEDTILRLRSHPSLLFYGGCNECVPPNEKIPSPPVTIDQGIRSAIDKYDPGRFYISSSMGGKNRSYSLAEADGPYSFQFPETYFNRNPGHENHNSSIGFQPELGPYASSPTYEGLLRFMSASDAEEGFPKRDGIVNNTVWEHHNFISWTTGSYDHVYAYFDETIHVKASDWCAAAQLAAHLQNLYLFMGFLSHTFEYTSAVLLWKTQSPWPSLRGFLYDWWLESTGTFRGVKAALHQSVSVTFDPRHGQLGVVNRHLSSLVATEDAPIEADYRWVNLGGTVVSSGRAKSSPKSIPSMSSSTLEVNGLLEYPRDCRGVCFLRLQPIVPGMGDFQPTWVWLTDPSLGKKSDFTALGTSRKYQTGLVSFGAVQCSFNKMGELQIVVEIIADDESPEVVFYPTLSVINTKTGLPILPLFDSGDTDLVILPGESQERILSTMNSFAFGLEVSVQLSTWNSAPIQKHVVCSSFIGDTSSLSVS